MRGGVDPGQSALTWKPSQGSAEEIPLLDQPHQIMEKDHFPSPALPPLLGWALTLLRLSLMKSWKHRCTDELWFPFEMKVRTSNTNESNLKRPRFHICYK